MNTYHIHLEEEGTLMRIAFGEQAMNDQIVRDADAQLIELKAKQELKGGSIIRVNGPASLPVAMVISHHLVHLYQTVAAYDPKLAKYVVISNHGGGYALGELID